MKRMLYISHCLPYPPDKGDRVRAFHAIVALSEHFEITLVALARRKPDDSAVQELRAYCREIIVAPVGGKLGLVRAAGSLLRGGSATEGFFASSAIHGKVQSAASAGPFDIAVGFSSSTLGYLLAAPAGARVMDLVDVDSVKWASYADSARWPVAALYRAEARGVGRLERLAVASCDAVVLVSQAEIEAMPVGGDNLVAAGNGVDTDYYHPSPSPQPFPSPLSLVFTGQMDYRPNVEGVCWFVREVWPLLRRDYPELRFHVVGREPTPAVRRLAQAPGVVVTGAVPDVRPYLWAASAAVCPLKIARGIQNKVLEAMACGVAVVASPPAAEGISDEGREHLHVAQSPQEWAKAVGLLLSDGQRRLAAGSAGRRWVELRHTWSAQLAPMIALSRNLCRRGPAAAVDSPGLAGA